MDERSVGPKPKRLDMAEAAAMPLTYVTAYQALVEQMKIEVKEKAAVLIINGAGGVGAVASQIARQLLELPVVITTASRPESVDFTKQMGATHVLNHREDLEKQIQKLNLDVPVKWVLIPIPRWYVTDIGSGIYSSRIPPTNIWKHVRRCVRRSAKSVQLYKARPRCMAQSSWPSRCHSYGA